MPPYTVAMNIIERPDPQWGDLSSALHNILPYANDLALEASEMLNNIIHHLGLCLQSEDYAPGAVYWGKQLHLYVPFFTLELTSRHDMSS
jgi:hypothetical protein